MRITPMDIRQQQFTVRMFRGFDVQEVDTFLEDVAQDYEALIKENALLKEQLQMLEDAPRGLEDREKVLQQTLVTTQQVAEEMKEGARREAALILREAELEGEKLLESNAHGGGHAPQRDPPLKRHAAPGRGGTPLHARHVPAHARPGPQAGRGG